MPNLLAGLSASTPRSLLEAAWMKHNDSLQAKLVSAGEKELSPNDAGWVTKWSQAMETISTWIVQQNNNDTKPTTATGENRSNDGPDMKAMVADCKALPELNAAINVEVFVRAASLKFDTHVKKKKVLEPHFITQIVMKLCSEFRASHNAHIQSTPITTWVDMEKYLMSKHQSSTTAHQELRMVNDMQMQPHEELRNFAARLESKGSEKLCVIKAKYKRDNKDKELDVEALWQLFMGQTLINNMQASPKYSEHYARVLVDLNGLYRVEELSKKADVLYEKEQRLDHTFLTSPPSTALSVGDVSKIMDDKFNTLLSKLDVTENTTDNNNGQICYRFRDNGKCNRYKCQFRHVAADSQ